MPNIGAPELIVILVIALLIIGPGKLPDVGSALGKSIREFRKATTDEAHAKEAAAVAAQQAPAAPLASAPVAPAAPTTTPEPNVLHTPSTPPASESTVESNR